MQNSTIQAAPLLEAVELTKVYEDGVKALNNLNLVVREGEIYAMLGGNGAGKTTTINAFLDFIQPTSGKALINGIDANALPLEAKNMWPLSPKMCSYIQILPLCRTSISLSDWEVKVTMNVWIMSVRFTE